eukprot:4197345-Prymnesium_polylepis.1
MQVASSVAVPFSCSAVPVSRSVLQATSPLVLPRLVASTLKQASATAGGCKPLKSNVTAPARVKSTSPLRLTTTGWCPPVTASPQRV